ncbi:MAG: aminopeptidase P N-terminal domain-containing protein, partial [Phycisphaerae bacterium]|nr:aminopeptidase P N-terminal domain-containing protein [Phycisphaerae bacterium]
MFPAEVYIERRRRLVEQINSGLILFMGNNESPMNYPDNIYPFRQDGSFLYYFGLDDPSLAAVIDVDDGSVCLFGDDLTVDDIVWTGPLPTVSDRARVVGIDRTAPLGQLHDLLHAATVAGRAVRFLPQY